MSPLTIFRSRRTRIPTTPLEFLIFKIENLSHEPPFNISFLSWPRRSLFVKQHAQYCKTFVGFNLGDSFVEVSDSSTLHSHRRPSLIVINETRFNLLISHAGPLKPFARVRVSFSTQSRWLAYVFHDSYIRRISSLDCTRFGTQAEELSLSAAFSKDLAQLGSKERRWSLDGIRG